MPRVDGRAFLEWYAQHRGGADEVREECVATMVSSSEDPEERARAMGDDFVGGFITKKAHDS